MFRRSNTLPGPRALPLIGSPWVVTRDPLAGLERMTRTYGDLSQVRIGPRRMVVVNHPDLVEEVLLRKKNATIKDTVTRQLANILGNGLVTSDGAHWKKQRKAVAPSFQPRHLVGYADAMVQSAAECVPNVGLADVHVDMSATTLHIVLRTLFGTEPSGEATRVGELVEGLMTAFFREQRSYWRMVPKRIPAAHRRSVNTIRTELDALIFGLIEKARKEPDGSALVHRLLTARDNDGASMSDVELRDELLTLFLAGHETTSLLLSFTLWLLAEHPELQARAHAEVDTVVGERLPTLKDLENLPYLRAVLKETLRMYPAVWAIARETTEPIELGGHTLDTGTQIVLCAWTLQRDSRFWVGPERYRPERWLTDETKDVPRMAYLPFGGGPRICVGQHFAMMEAMLALAVILQKRRFTTVPGFTPTFLPSVTLRPADGVQVHSHAR